VDRLLAEQRDLDGDLARYDIDERRIAAVDQWLKSEIVWLDELYDLTARFPDVNRLRVTSLQAEPVPLPPPTPGRPMDPDKAVAAVKLKGVTTDDASLNTLTRELVRDVYRVIPTERKGNNTGGGRRQSRVEWGLTYQLVHVVPDASTRKFTATPPERNERGRGRGAGVGDFPDLFNLGGPP
jgi:hypothetical protein